MNKLFGQISIAVILSVSITTVQAQSWGERLDKAIGGNNNNQNNQNNNQNNNNNSRNNNNSNNRNNNNGSNNQSGNNNNSSNNNAGNSGNNNGGRGGGLFGGNSNLGNGLGNTEIINGLKEALSVGARNAGSRLNVANGFFGNNLIKILMPPEAAKVENALRQVGMGKLVDDAILSMNRAAEDAAGKAAPIFVNAVTSMNIQDGLNILRGGNGAATEFLKQKTTMALTEAFRPVIQTALDKANATTLWNKVFSAYNKLPMTRQKINPDLVAYATERALSGLFVTIADEESKIRTNPAARVTSLLQKVFGG